MKKEEILNREEDAQNADVNIRAALEADLTPAVPEQ